MNACNIWTYMQYGKHAGLVCNAKKYECMQQFKIRINMNKSKLLDLIEMLNKYESMQQFKIRTKMQ